MASKSCRSDSGLFIGKEDCFFNFFYDLKEKELQCGLRQNYPSVSKLYKIEVKADDNKTDSDIRPIHHPKDNNTEAHIFVAIVACQLAHAIRCALKQEGWWQVGLMFLNICFFLLISLKI